MPRFTSPDKTIVIETSVASEISELRRDGFTEQKAKTKDVRATDSQLPPALLNAPAPGAPEDKKSDDKKPSDKK